MTREAQNAWVIGATLTSGQAGFLNLRRDGAGTLVPTPEEATAWSDMQTAMILGEHWAETQSIDHQEPHGLFAQPVEK